MLSSLVITFLVRSKRLLISWLQSPSAVILESIRRKSGTVSTLSPSICHEVMGPDAMILVFWMVSCKTTFSLSSAPVRSIPFLSFVEPIFSWNVLLVSLIFLKRSLGFPILFFPSISLHWSLRKAFLSLLAILWNSAFKWEYLYFSLLLFTSLLFSAICKSSSESHFCLCALLFLRDGLDPCFLYNVTNLCP